MIRYAFLKTPLGGLGLVTSKGRLTQVRFLRDRPIEDVAAALEVGSTAQRCDTLGDIVERVHAYFAGELTAFDAVMCEPAGTEFQRQVWHTLREIPAGKTRSYGDIARRLGKPGASRAVGAANGANPIPLIIPCHRVIGANGHLTGFSSGLDLKVWLLRHEGFSKSLHNSTSSSDSHQGMGCRQNRAS